MKKRSVAAISPTAFSSSSQFTSPPFSVAIESAGLRRRMLEEMLRPPGGKPRKPPAKRPSKKRSAKLNPGPE